MLIQTRQQLAWLRIPWIRRVRRIHVRARDYFTLVANFIVVMDGLGAVKNCL